MIYRTDQTAAIPAGDRAFGSGFDANWRSLGGPETAIASDARSGLTPEEREFQDWRAWQEWKRRNPK